MGITEYLVGFRRPPVCAAFWRNGGDSLRAVLPDALPEERLC